MFSAVDHDNIDKVKKLLADGADRNCQGFDGRYCLYRAAEQKHMNMVKLLLIHGASSRPKGYNTALYWAARGGSVEIARILLDHEDATGLTPKVPGNNATFLHAVFKRNEDIARILIEYSSVDIAFKDKYGETPMRAAAQYGLTAIVKMLLAYGANADDKSKGETPLIWAIKGCDLETIKVLCIEGKTQVNVTNFTSEHDQPPLWHAACLQGYEGGASDDVVKYLLESGADPNVWNKRNSSPLQEAASRGLGNGVQMLLDHGADAYPIEGGGYGYPPIVEGANSGSESVVKLLLGAKAKDITARDRQREQALIYASMRGERDVILLLLEEGIDINTEGYHGETPLIYAIDEKQISTARLLIRRGAREDKSDGYGRLPLFMATEQGLDVVVKEIVKNTKNPDVQNVEGDTSLCVAAAKGQENVVKVLLDSSADRDIANKFGDTPLDLAVEGHHKKIAEMLE